MCSCTFQKPLQGRSWPPLLEAARSHLAADCACCSPQPIAVAAVHHVAGQAVVLLHSREHSAEETGQQWQKAHLMDWAAITLQHQSTALESAVEAVNYLMSWPGLTVHVTHMHRRTNRTLLP